SEYLADAADVIWSRPKDKGRRDAWLNALCSQRKHEPNGVQAILNELRAINVQRWPVARAEILASCITYLTNQSHRMKYSAYQAAGMPIGYGVTEAACKTLVKQRLCRSGMQWSEKGAQVILSLRALVLTASRWNQFWNKINQYGVPDLRRV
ncbi:MAG: ISKra4 family transposase, partial [Rhodoferax sp.]